MEKTKTVPIYAKIDENVKNRVELYISQARILKMSKTNNIRKFMEEAFDQYLINNPIPVDQENP